MDFFKNGSKIYMRANACALDLSFTILSAIYDVVQTLVLFSLLSKDVISRDEVVWIRWNTNN